MYYIYGPQTSIFDFDTRPEVLATSQHCIDHLEKALYNIGIAPEKIQILSTPGQLARLKEKNPIILFPGGYSLALMHNLKGTHEKIHELVRNGASLIGVCAGAIVLSSALVEKGFGDIASARTEAGDKLFGGPLALSKVESMYPVYRDEKGKPDKTLRVTHIKIPSSSESIKMSFIAGTHFEMPKEPQEHEILAHYEDSQDPPNAVAAWHTCIGEGTISAFGFHPELPLPGTEEPNPAGLALLKAELAWIAAHRQKDEAGSAE